jgi:outer membrane protein TolC
MKPGAIIFSITVIILAVGHSPAQAGEGPRDVNTPVRLQDYLRLAAANNAGLKAEFEQWKAAAEQITQAKALMDPQLTYERVIEQHQDKIGLMQMFPWFGEIRARTDAAAAAADAANKRYEAKKLDLFFKVKEAFHEYVYLASAIRIAAENLELLKHFEEVSRAKYITATAEHPDVIRAQVEIAKAQDDLKTLEQLREPITARLNALLNRQSGPAEGGLPWPEKEKFEVAKLNHQHVLEVLRKQNPELQAIELDLAEARSRLELAGKKSYPTMGAGIGWMDSGGSGSSMSGNEDSLMLMFVANVPIWRENYKAEKLQAKAELRKISHQKKDSENTLLARAEQVLYELDDSVRKIELYGDILIPKGLQLLGASEAAYKAGAIDFLSLIDAQQTLLNFQLQHERAMADNRQRLAELEMLVGADASALATETQENGK